MIKHIIDFHENVDYSVLQGRSIIYLDMNIWIELADEKTSLAGNVKELLKILVNDRKLFCPLYSSVLSELYKQNPSSMLRVGKLMEELSLNFCFVQSKEIWREEVRLFVQTLLDEKVYRISKEYLFIPYIGYLSSKGMFTYPKDVDENEALKITNVIKNNLDKATLSNVISLATRKKVESKKYSAMLNQHYKEVWANNKGNKSKIRIENQNYLAKTKILPIIHKMNRTLKPEQVYKITKYITSFPKDDRKSVFNSIIDFMPSIRNEVDILSIVPLDNQRKITINDYYDIENLIVPLAYSDAFVSRDKWIKHLLKVTNLPKKNNCKYLYDLESFVQFLSKNYLLN